MYAHDGETLMLWSVSIDVEQPDLRVGDKPPLLLQPIPPGEWFQRVAATRYTNAALAGRLTADALSQGAMLLCAVDNRALSIGFDIELTMDRPDASVWRQPDNRYTRATIGLVDTARSTVAHCANQADAVRALVEHAAVRFEYAHPKQRFNDATAEMPLVCGTAQGSCVDMHGYIMAMANAVGLKAQYLAGYWVHPEKSQTHDMHCWLMFEADGDIVYWDLAHHLKWRVPELAPALNPAGGRRVLMSHGRGLVFHTPYGCVEVSHFSEPLWIMPDGSIVEPQITVRIDGPHMN